MGTTTGTSNSKARSAHARFARIAALILGGVLVAWMASGTWPWNY